MRREIDLDEFCRFAKSYLSEAFPNPQRIGSPADSALTDWGVRSAFSYNARPLAQISLATHGETIRARPTSRKQLIEHTPGSSGVPKLLPFYSFGKGRQRFSFSFDHRPAVGSRLSDPFQWPVGGAEKSALVSPA